MQKKILKTTLIVALVLLAGVSIAYAALSTTLNITFGKVTQNALTWNVGFTGTEATGETGGTSGTGRSCGKATITASAITLADTTLSKPGDKCTYTFTIKNSGTVGAKLNTITPTAPTSITCGIATGGTLECGNITYKLTTDKAGSTVLTTGGTLAADKTLTVYLVVSYTGSSLNASAVTHNGAKFALAYTQA